jgi:hypothetical protein
MLNDRVRTLNQSGGKVLTLNIQEARSLQAEIYDLMATIANLSRNSNANDPVNVSMDGGKF